MVVYIICGEIGVPVENHQSAESQLHILLLVVGRLISSLNYLYLCAHSGIQRIFIISVAWRISYLRFNKQKLLVLRMCLCSPQKLWCDPCCSSFQISMLCCFFCLACLRLISCLPNVTTFSRLSFLDCPFGFSLEIIYNVKLCRVLLAPGRNRTDNLIFPSVFL